eukprot:1667946-Pyramimonas_sp.AAC.1
MRCSCASLEAPGSPGPPLLVAFLTVARSSSSASPPRRSQTGPWSPTGPGPSARGRRRTTAPHPRRGAPARSPPWPRCRRNSGSRRAGPPPCPRPRWWCPPAA